MKTTQIRGSKKRGYALPPLQLKCGGRKGCSLPDPDAQAPDYLFIYNGIVVALRKN